MKQKSFREILGKSMVEFPKKFSQKIEHVQKSAQKNPWNMS